MIDERRIELKNFRENHNLTQREMADKLEISLIQYQFIELGHRNPSIKVLVRFKKCFPKANIENIFLEQNFTNSKQERRR